MVLAVSTHPVDAAKQRFWEDEDAKRIGVEVESLRVHAYVSVDGAGCVRESQICHSLVVLMLWSVVAERD